MKLKNTEVLLLTQVLYHIKCSDSYFEFSDEIHELHDKLCAHLLNEKSEEGVPREDEDMECAVHDDDSLFEVVESISDDDSEDSRESIAIKDVVLLKPVRVEHADKKKTFLFELGTSKSMLDINLDDGEEILCDVTDIERHSDSFIVRCVSGWLTFDVQKFPKSWTSLLKHGIHYKVI
jgi:hypothetical protein